MRYSLRTLLIVMLLGGPLCAWGWKAWQEYRAREACRKFDELIDLIQTTVIPNSSGPYPRDDAQGEESTDSPSADEPANPTD